MNKDDDDDSEWAAFFVASCDHGGLPSPPPLPPVPLIFQASEVKREAGVERQTHATREGSLRKFLSKKRNEREKFSDSEVCDKIKRLAN